MGASSSIETDQPIRAGPSHEPTPPDDIQLRQWRAALKNSNLKHGDSRKLKAAALGIFSSFTSCLLGQRISGVFRGHLAGAGAAPVCSMVAVALVILENYCFQDEPACQISSSGVMSFKRQMQTHRADCSTWTTTVVGKNFKYATGDDYRLMQGTRLSGAVACVKGHAKKAHHPMITGGRS